MTDAKSPTDVSKVVEILRSDESGIAITEFGFVAPVFCMMLMGIFDLGFGYYTESVLEGAVQEGARQASLENTLWSDIENRVRLQVLEVLPSSNPDTEISFKLEDTAYENYQDVQMPEDFEDIERNKVRNFTYDAAEPFVDANGNGVWDPGEDFTDTAPYNMAYNTAEAYTDSNGNGRWDFGEPYTDELRGTRNGTYDPDECFVDLNTNGKWDADVGVAGRGGAQDVVWIRASVTYKRIFPLWRFIGQPQDITLTAQSFLRNQPFDGQPGRVGVRICPT